VPRDGSAPLIRRDDHGDWLIIPQIEHARIAGELARAWGNERFASLAAFPTILWAVEHHDDGWRDWDAAPRLNPATGIPRSFMEMRMRDSTAIWTRSIDFCSSEPLAGIAVSRHFTYLAEQVRSGGRSDADDLEAIDRFLGDQDNESGDLAPRLRRAEDATVVATCDRGFRTVRFFDAVSLWLCCAERQEPEQMTAPDGESIKLIPEDAWHVAIDPYPLGVNTPRLQTFARRVAARRYENDDDFLATFDAAPLELLAWTIGRA
jgi:hypothetical protein